MHIPSCDDGWVALCDGLISNTTIEDITFGDIIFDDTLIELSYNVCNVLAKLLANTTTIRKVTFRGFCIPSIDSISIFSEGLAKNRSIQTLQFYQIETNGFDILLDALHQTNITNLSIIDCDIDFDNEDNIENEINAITTIHNSFNNNSSNSQQSPSSLNWKTKPTSGQTVLTST